MKTSDTVELPITTTARKYGYVIWAKTDDEKMRALLGDRDMVSLEIAGVGNRHRQVDWKQRRISLGYKLTRGLANNVRFYRLSRSTKGKVIVLFE